MSDTPRDASSRRAKCPSPPPGDRDRDIDAHLKLAFQSLADEAVPDRFAALLDQLRADEDAEKAK